MSFSKLGTGMNLLAIDTSTEACSAAVLRGQDPAALFERYEIAPQRHGELILPMCEAVLGEAGLAFADLTGLAFGRGPGAFTGVRIAAGVIQGFALATGLRVAPVSSLETMARLAMRDTGHRRVYAAIDARLGEVYCAAWDLDLGDDPCVAERLARPDRVPAVDGDDWLGIGSGFANNGDVLRARLGPALRHTLPRFFPRAGEIARLAVAIFAEGRAVAADEALPIYLRDQVAAIPSPR